MLVRKFIEGVLAYTGKKQVIVISHSMGVTLARKALKGGSADDHIKGKYFVGESLKNRTETFVGIAGGNLGLLGCYPNPEVPTCNIFDGFFPGTTAISPPS